MVTEKELSGKEIKVILAHGDGDGLACAAIALRKYPDAKLVFTEPTAIATVLSWREVERPVLVLDLAGVAPEDGVFVIDHHPSPPNPPSCAELMRGWDTATEYLVQLGQASDQVNAPLPRDVRDDAEVLYLILGCLEPREADRARAVLVRALAAGRRVGQMDDIMRAYEKIRVEAERIISDSTKRAEELAEYHKDAVIIVYPDTPQGYAGRVADHFKDRVFTVFLVWSPKGQTVVTIRARIRDAGKIVEQIRAADSGFISGGGHAHAASFSSRTPVQEIKRLITSVLD